MNSPEIKAFIRENAALFSHTIEDNIEEISPDHLVETILIYGDIPEIIKLIQLYGIKEVAKIFFDIVNQIDGRKCNFDELTLNYFTLFFNKHAQ